MNTSKEHYILSNGRKPSILAVDDDPANLGVISEYLKDFGFRILVARDGESAVEKAKHGRPDLILLDLLMPKIDGFETFHRLKADKSLEDIPIIFMTALTDTANKVKGFQAGCVDYVTKPLQYEEVLARIKTHLTLHSMRKQLETQNVQLHYEITTHERMDKELQKAHAELEQRVKERTAELAQANASLKAEIAERKKAEEARVTMENRLHQAGKMESIGLLAGGIAHDFNNLLMPILGYADLLLTHLAQHDPSHDPLQQIKQAAERARDLTQQLLAFSRRQVLELKTLDLGSVVKNFEQILRRTIRENVQIQIAVSAEASLIRADVSQVQQVLMNLAVNAQDAMPNGGMLTIMTENTFLDETYIHHHPETAMGPYVMLAVSDTGHGMDQKTQEHLFEPFFTTKGRCKGTGLGLSTVHGIVKQHAGNISVYSEPGKGSTFKVYLPRCLEPTAMLTHPCPAPKVVARGNETVLVVEDNPTVRKLVCEMLQDLGYRTLSAESTESIHLVENFQGKIDMLLTDVVMPKMDGRETYNQLKARLKGLKVLFMSGYTSNIIVHHHVLDQGVHFMQKPLTLSSLSEKVRKVLDE